MKVKWETKQVDRRGRGMRQWYWRITYWNRPPREGYCFTKKGAYRKAGMDQDEKSVTVE